MFRKTQKKPYESLTNIGEHYEVTIMEEDSLGNEIHSVIRCELRGWEHEEETGLLYVILWEVGHTRAQEHYVGDILRVKAL